jgi:uncharacterized protein YdaU (DUF1376 family)
MVAGKAPAFQFYAAEYLADENVQLLTLEQEGIYIRLLAYCWREGSIPADPVKLSRLCKNAPAEALESVVGLFFPGSDGRLIHGRLEAERRKHEEYRRTQAANGSRGGRPRKRTPYPNNEKGSGFSNESQSEVKKRSTSALASSTSSESRSKEQEPIAFTSLALLKVEPLLTIPLNDTSEFPISNDKVFEWVPLYPGIDVRQELRAYKAWAINNPTQRKTRSGILRSINFWLGNAQNKTRSMGGGRNNGFTASIAGPATIRQRRSDDAIDSAAQFLTNQPAGCVNEASKGELSHD